MIFEYFRQALRSLEKNKTYAALNIIGLSAGLACFAFIASWVNDELSYDKFNENYDRIYRVVGSARTESGISESAVSSAPMAAALINDYPEVENAVRFDMREEIIDHNGKNHFSPTYCLPILLSSMYSVTSLQKEMQPLPCQNHTRSSSLNLLQRNILASPIPSGSRLRFICTTGTAPALLIK